MADETKARPLTEHVDTMDLHEVTVHGSTALKAALEKEPPQKWHPVMIRLYAIVAVAFLCSSINGYDGSLMSNMLAMPAYQKEFGASIVGAKAGYISAMYTIGGASALPFVGPAIDTWGRRIGMVIGCSIIVMGAIVQGTSGITGNLGHFLGGRFFLGFGHSIAAAAAPIYVVEMAHPAYRGPLAGYYNIIWNVGGVIAAGTLRAGQNYEGNKSWLIPTWIQLMLPSIVLLLVMWLPESPRWLYVNGKKEEAMCVITKYHGLGNPDSVYLSLQRSEYETGLNENGTDKRFWDYRGLFKNRASRYRLVCALMVTIFSQWCGTGFVGYFMPAFLATAGITNPVTVLNINLGTSFIGIFASATGASLVERIGRRKLFYRILLVEAFWWALITISAALYAETGSAGAGTAAIVFVNFFGITYAFGVMPLTALYPVEVLSYEQRAKGMAFSQVVLNIAILVNQLGMPVAIQKIGWKLYIIFIFWVSFQAMVAFFFMVETKGRTLEELDEIFEAKNPRKASTQKKVIVLDGAANIVDIEKI